MRTSRFANSVLVGAALLALAVAAYAIVVHTRFLVSPIRSLVFLGLPLAGAGLCLALLRLAPEKRLVAALVLLAGGVALYGFEGMLGLIERPAASEGPSKYQIALELRRQGKDAYPATFPAYLLATRFDGSVGSPIALDGTETLPLGGIARTTTVLCAEGAAPVVYESDGLGFNNPSDLGRRVEPMEVLLLGDSFVHGYCVEPAKSLAALVRSQRPLTVNLAMSGNGPLLELAGLREFAPLFRPKHVVWVFFEGNDVENLAVERRSPLLLRYLDSDVRQGLAENAAKLDAVYRQHLDQLFAATPERRETDAGPLQRVVSFVGLARTRARFGGESHSAIDGALLDRILSRANDTAGGRLTLVYLPYRQRYEPGARGIDGLDVIRATIRDIAARRSLRLLDLVDVFAAEPDPRGLYDGHLSERGQRVTADAILKSLENR